MEIKKESVKLWSKSWFNLLYAMSLNLPKLNDTQYYTSFDERPPESGNFVFTSRPVQNNTRNILNEIASQLDMTEGLEAALKHHSQIADIQEDGKQSYSRDEVKELTW